MIVKLRRAVSAFIWALAHMPEAEANWHLRRRP